MLLAFEKKISKWKEKIVPLSDSVETQIRWTWRGGAKDYFVLRSRKKIYGIIYAGEMDKGSVIRKFHSLYSIGIVAEGEFKMIGGPLDFEILSARDGSQQALFSNNTLTFSDGKKFQITELRKAAEKAKSCLASNHEIIAIVDDKSAPQMYVEDDAYNPKVRIESGANVAYISLIALVTIYVQIKRREQAIIYTPS